MAVNVQFFTFRGYAFDSGDISYGEAESQDININRNSEIQTVQIRKESVTFTLRGATDTDLTAFEDERNTNIDALIAGTAVPENIDILGKTISSALLYSVTPSGPKYINGSTIYESIELEYRSQVWS